MDRVSMQKTGLTLCQACSKPVKISHHRNTKKNTKNIKKNVIEMNSGPGRGLNPGPRTVNTLEHAGLNTRSANHTARPPGQLLRRHVVSGLKYVAEPGHANLGCATETPQSEMVCAGSSTPKFD